MSVPAPGDVKRLDPVSEPAAPAAETVAAKNHEASHEVASAPECAVEGAGGRLLLGLRHPAGARTQLESRFWSVANPAHASYRHHLTVEDLRAMLASDATTVRHVSRDDSHHPSHTFRPVGVHRPSAPPERTACVAACSCM